jgi:hypothetical protein
VYVVDGTVVHVVGNILLMNHKGKVNNLQINLFQMGIQ